MSSEFLNLSITLSELGFQEGDSLSQLLQLGFGLGGGQLLLLLDLGDGLLLLLRRLESVLQVDQLGGSVGTSEPSIEVQVRLVTTARREQVVLEQVGPSGDLERKRAELSTGNLVQANDFVDTDVAGTTVNSSTSGGGLVGSVGGNFEDHLVRLVVGGNLVVSDTSVTLKRKSVK